jgi:hypothetical protein
MSLAPLIVDGKVILGASGGELGVRGFVAAVDAESGKPLWKTYTIPAPGEPGADTWPAGGDHYKRGGGAVWITGTYDPETNLTFWGTGNAAPWFGDQRPGDNLYTSSVIALDANTGRHQGPFPVSPQRFVGLGRGFAADGGRLQARRESREGTDQRLAQRLHLGSRAHSRQDQFRGRPARMCARTCSRASIPRPAGRDRRRAQARHRQGCRVLPEPVGRQGLAAGRLQSPHAHDLHPANDNLCHELVGEAAEVRASASATWAWRRTS